MCALCWKKKYSTYCYSRHNCFECLKRYKLEDYPQEYKDKYFCPLCNQHYNEIKHWRDVCKDQKKESRKCSHLNLCRVKRVTMRHCDHHACFDCRIKWKKEKNLSCGCHVVGCSNTRERDRCEPDYSFDAEQYQNIEYVECVICAPGCEPPEREHQSDQNDCNESEPSYSSWEL